MKNVLTLFLSALMLCLIDVKAQVEVTNYGDIPEAKLAISRWQNVKWDGSGNWTTIDVTTKGILPNKTVDIAPLVSQLISDGSGKRILKFPAGTFHIKSRLNISKSDIQIVGEGSSTKFLLEGGASPGGISAGGSKTGDYKLSNDVSRGENKVTFTNASGLNVGDYFLIKQAGSVTRAGASGDETQIFKVLAKSGNTLTLDMKFGIPFKKSSSSSQKLNYKTNLRFHDFYMEMTSKPTGGKSDNMALNTVRNVEVSNIESNKALNTHVQVFRGREVILHDNNFYGNYGGGGGFQYGIKMNWCTNCHMINNVAANLRHHYATQYGSNHCVIAYNRALPPYNDYADYGQHNSKGCHNNLFEGNYGKEIYDDANPLKSWGTRYTMWFRNHATSKVGSENAYVENMNIIGNELKTGSGGIKKGSPGENTFAGANIVNINKEGGTGTMVWGDFSASSDIPASLFLKDRPSYVVRWPLYGPDATIDNEGNLAPTAEFVQPVLTTLEEGYDLLYVLVDASDPNEGDVITTVLFIDDVEIRTEAVAPYEWGKEGGNTTNETLNLTPGSHVLEVRVSDDKGASVTITKTLVITEEVGPYTGVPIAIPGVLEFENYNKGGQGVSFSDSDTENKGASESNFRINDGVDIDTGNEGLVIGWTSSNEWMEYTVTVASTGQYECEFQVASLNVGGLLGVDIDGVNTKSGIVIPQTNDWETYTSFVETVTLEEGEHVLRFNIESAGFNLDKVVMTNTLITSVEEESALFSVYPNPVLSHLTIKGEESIRSIVIMDVAGQTVASKVGPDNTIDASRLKSGVYILQILTENGWVNKKFTKD